jgi:hypothetical protein
MWEWRRFPWLPSRTPGPRSSPWQIRSKGSQPRPPAPIAVFLPQSDEELTEFIEAQGELVRKLERQLLQSHNRWCCAPASDRAGPARAHDKLLHVRRSELGSPAERSTSARGKFDKSQGRLTHRTGPSEYTYTFPAAQFVGVALDSVQIIAAAAHH